MPSSSLQMLEDVIADRTLAWERASIGPEDVGVGLSSDAIAELEGNRDALAVEHAAFSESSHSLEPFPQLAAEVRRLVADRIERGHGLCVIDGEALADFSDTQQRNVQWVISLLLGKPLEQYATGERYVIVKDRGQRMTDGGRYHQSNEGGELHTDSPQYDRPPDYLVLHCLYPGKIGGESKFISVYALHNRLLKQCPELLSELYGEFYFERRGSKEAQPTVAPILAYDGRDLTLRYLGSYVRSGHVIVGKPLTEAQAGALDELDRLLTEDQLQLTYPLKRGDIALINNGTVVHGRSSFTDHPAGAKAPRELGRVWLASDSTADA